MADLPASVVLIPTCDKHSWVARLNRVIIQEEWPGHPEIWFCGASIAGEPEWLPVRGDPGDWVGILQDAVETLWSRGTNLVYLILDDHLPVGPCHTGHLNTTYPKLMQTEGLDRLALFGGGQFQPRDGHRVRIGNCLYERPSPGCDWVFCLHPALWRVEALRTHLEEMRNRSEKEVITAWEYEWLAAKGIREGAFASTRHLRIVGESAAATGKPPQFLWVWAFVRALVRWTSTLARMAGAEATAGKVQAGAQSFSKYYHGPYPYFWSGVLLRGKIQSDLVRWLKFSGRERLAQAIQAAGAANL